MGEKIRDLSKFTINNREVAIELNESYSRVRSEYDIHIQSKAIQYSLTDSEFMSFASLVATAKRRFESMKEFENINDSND